MAGFNNDLYIQKQSEQIYKRIKEFGGKLYLEFGGKLFDDYHASRVLPGFQPDSKLRMLKKLKDDVEIVLVINAGDIDKNKMRSDLGITYDEDILRLIDAFRGVDLYVSSVVIGRYDSRSGAVAAFRKKLERAGIKVFLHYDIEDYPNATERILSEEGFGKNDYIETTRPLVVITAPGPGSGKMATCLSQLYHENKRGIKAGYAKFETFPIWNLPLKHPVNIAYEAATADLDDVNMIDPYHLEAYGKTAVNYNRDIEVFPVLNAMFEKISGVSPYKSPTDMGVNMAGYCIEDDEAVRKAANAEIIRRYFTALCDAFKNNAPKSIADKIERLMSQSGISVDDRPVVKAALDRSEETGHRPAVAIQLKDGTIVTGKTTELLGAASAAILNAIKILAGIPKPARLIEPEIIEPIQTLKTEILGNRSPCLHIDEVLIALSVCAQHNDTAKAASDKLCELRGAEAHSSVLLSQVDQDVFRKLGMNLTCEPRYETKKLYHSTKR